MPAAWRSCCGSTGRPDRARRGNTGSVEAEPGILQGLHAGARRPRPVAGSAHATATDSWTEASGSLEPSPRRRAPVVDDNAIHRTVAIKVREPPGCAVEAVVSTRFDSLAHRCPLGCVPRSGNRAGARSTRAPRSRRSFQPECRHSASSARPFDDIDDTVDPVDVESLAATGRPAHLQALDRCARPEPEPHGHLRLRRVARSASNAPTLHARSRHELDDGADSIAIRRRAPRVDRQPAHRGAPVVQRHGP